MSGERQLEGRTAVVSGAASDIGAAIAQRFAEQGASVVLGDIDRPRLEAAADAAGRGSCEVVEADVTRSEAMADLVEHAQSRFGSIDVMVNLAGVIFDRPVVEIEEDELDRLLAVNLKGVLFGCQAAARVMMAAGRGSIVNMASLAAFIAIPELAGYAMSKAAVAALTRVLAVEAGPSGVRVNAVAPGFVEGGMTTRHIRRPDGSIDATRMEEVRARSAARNPLRSTGRPDDVASAFLYLASDASRFVNGQVLHVNGGSYMG